MDEFTIDVSVTTGEVCINHVARSRARAYELRGFGNFMG